MSTDGKMHFLATVSRLLQERWYGSSRNHEFMDIVENALVEAKVRIERDPTPEEALDELARVRELHANPIHIVAPEGGLPVTTLEMAQPFLYDYETWAEPDFPGLGHRLNRSNLVRRQQGKPDYEPVGNALYVGVSFVLMVRVPRA